LLVEIDVVHFTRVVRYCEGLLKELIFFISQVDLLSEEDSSKLLGNDESLS
jgi:hypothetical protein